MELNGQIEEPVDPVDEIAHVFVGKRIVERQHWHPVGDLAEAFGNCGADLFRRRIGQLEIVETALRSQGCAASAHHSLHPGRSARPGYDRPRHGGDFSQQPLKFGFRLGLAQRIDRLGLVLHLRHSGIVSGFRATDANEKPLAFPFAAVNRRLRIG
jgi:hypothetical protein